jgi:hypothetical protein
LALDLRQQQFLPALGAVDIAGAQFCRQAVAFAVEQQQRVIAGTLEVAVVGALLLFAVDRNLGVGSPRGDCSPEAPTDPDVRNSRIRLFGPRLCYVTVEGRMRGCGSG